MKIPYKRRFGAIVVGKTGYGKSYVVQTKIVPLLKRVVIFDLLREKEYEQKGFTIFEDFDDIKEFLIENINSKNCKCIFRSMEFDEYEALFHVCIAIGNLTLIIEEIHTFGNDKAMSDGLEKIIRFGRHSNISFVGISQRLTDMSLLIRNNADILCVYRLQAPNDLKYLEGYGLLGDTQEERKENAWKIANLKKGECITFVKDW